MPSATYFTLDGESSSGQDDVSNLDDVGVELAGRGMQKMKRNSITSVGSSGSYGTSDTTVNIALQSFFEKVVENDIFNGIMILLVVWSIFNDDIRISACNSSADQGFVILISIIFFVFAFEIVCQVIGKKDYWNPLPPPKSLDESLNEKLNRCMQVGSFYFYLDIIATGTLIFELTWIVGDAFQGNDISAKSAKNTSASRSGGRAGRLIRVIRMVRLLRLAKLYKYAQIFVIYIRQKMTGKIAAKDKSKIEEMFAKVDKERAQTKKPPKSRLGAVMSDLMNQRVICLILALLIIIPLLIVSETDLAPIRATTYFHYAAVSGTNTTVNGHYLEELVLNKTVSFVSASMNNPIQVIDITFTDHTSGSTRYLYKWPSVPSYLRAEEIDSYFYDDGEYKTIARFSLRDQMVTSAQSSIYTTLFIIGLLLCSTMILTADVNRLVIKPIEHMLDLVHKISLNPLADHYRDYSESEGFNKGMETTILLSTISKIGRLMRVGFGEAGADIIAKDLADGDSKDLNLFGGGSVIQSLFGFCDVRQFTDTTECLQEEVMLFVNRIAHILHGIVVQCAGSANKNIGDAFLLTWKINDDMSQQEVSFLADNALLTFCKTLIEINKNKEFICNFTVAANTRLYKRFPNYAVRVGSGLHSGWAIEGAIGSVRKIDASYLSPHIQTTEYLESSTKAYGVPLLISQPFFDKLSAEAQFYCRQVDRIRKDEREEPMNIYTYDSDIYIDWDDTLAQRKAATAVLKDAAPTARRASIRAATTLPTNILLDLEKAELEKAKRVESKGENPIIIVPPYKTDVWETDADLVKLRHLVSDSTRGLWSTGMEAYLGGDWPKAKGVFLQTKALAGGSDGPSAFLLDLIESHKGKAPADWPGYRNDGDGGH